MRPTLPIGAELQSRKDISRQVFLQKAAPTILAVTKTTKPKDVIEAVQLHYNQRINSDAADRVLKFLYNDGIDHQRAQVCQLSDFISAMKAWALCTEASTSTVVVTVR